MTAPLDYTRFEPPDRLVSDEMEDYYNIACPNIERGFYDELQDLWDRLLNEWKCAYRGDDFAEDMDGYETYDTLKRLVKDWPRPKGETE